MSDDARSLVNRNNKPTRRRVLVVSNASPETSGDEGLRAELRAEPEPQKQPYPRPLPPHPPPSSSPSVYHGPRYPNFSPPSHIPPPLSTDIYPRSNPSNPALSSPSSTSSPGAPSETPPPSTPGTGAHPLGNMSEESTLRPGQITIPGERSIDNTPLASRPGLSSRIRANPHGRRGSSSGSRPATVRCVPFLPLIIPLIDRMA